LTGHSDWIRDLAFAPNIGLPKTYLASCSQDKTVIVWSRDVGEDNFKPNVLGSFGDVVWRVSWSLAGNLLAVSCGDNKVTLWKEGLTGKWELVGDINEAGEEQ
jgi:protein transport protein SEC13